MTALRRPPADRGRARRPLVLAAAGGLAREALETVRADSAYAVVGIVDDDPSRWGQQLDGVAVLGGLDVIADRPDAAVVLCAGRGSDRRRMAERLALPPDRYATVVHPSVTVPASCTIGAGSVLLAGVVLTVSVTIGGHAVVMPNATLTHDDVVHDHVTLCAGAVLGGRVTIGAQAYVGMAVAVRENVRIGAGATLGMGAVVLRDVPPGETWAGVPARRIARGPDRDPMTRPAARVATP